VLRPVELSGRGRKMLETPYRSLGDAVGRILMEIGDECKQGPYALLGHSMGALLVNELARQIKLDGLAGPKHLFFLGRGAPSMKVKEEDKFQLLDDARLIEKVLELGGTPPEIFDHPEWRRLYIPLLRNDFGLATIDLSHREIIPHDCPITVLLGKDEEICAESAGAWKLHTKGVCTLHYFNGGHFFYYDHLEAVTGLVNRELVYNYR
jgi:medium-chain acyl-[acyl-carrier-protein] hydrolase